MSYTFMGNGVLIPVNFNTPKVKWKTGKKTQNYFCSINDINSHSIIVMMLNMQYVNF